MTEEIAAVPGEPRNWGISLWGWGEGWGPGSQEFQEPKSPVNPNLQVSLDLGPPELRRPLPSSNMSSVVPVLSCASEDGVLSAPIFQKAALTKLQSEQKL